jgi:hypothetical protein
MATLVPCTGCVERESVVPAISQMMEWMRSGQGRLIAAAVLYILVWLLKAHVPMVEKWLQANGRLTSKHKKLLANVLLAMTPVAVVLTDATQPLGEAVVVAVQVALTAGGMQGFGKAMFPKAMATKTAVASPPSSDDNTEDEDGGAGDSDGDKADGSADETRRTSPVGDKPAAGDES